MQRSGLACLHKSALGALWSGRSDRHTSERDMREVRLCPGIIIDLQRISLEKSFNGNLLNCQTPPLHNTRRCLPSQAWTGFRSAKAPLIEKITKNTMTSVKNLEIPSNGRTRAWLSHQSHIVGRFAQGYRDDCRIWRRYAMYCSSLSSLRGGGDLCSEL